MNTRSRLLINPRFQLRYIAHSIFTALIVIGAVFAANRFLFWKFKQHGIAMGFEPTDAYFELINDQQYTSDLVFLILAISITLVLIIYGLIVSHKIAGPINHLCDYLKKRKSVNQTGPIRFREQDYFPELQHSINEFLGEEKK